jgi:hypothetical protein
MPGQDGPPAEGADRGLLDVHQGQKPLVPLPPASPLEEACAGARSPKRLQGLPQSLDVVQLLGGAQELSWSCPGRRDLPCRKNPRIGALEAKLEFPVAGPLHPSKLIRSMPLPALISAGAILVRPPPRCDVRWRNIAAALALLRETRGQNVTDQVRSLGGHGLRNSEIVRTGEAFGDGQPRWGVTPWVANRAPFAWSTPGGGSARRAQGNGSRRGREGRHRSGEGRSGRQTLR